MSKHTPGPWASVATMSSDFDFIRRIESDLAGQVAKVRVSTVLPQEEALANARLIAAAPDLLDLLLAAVSRVELANAEGDPILSAWLPDARAAITQATGERHEAT